MSKLYPIQRMIGTIFVLVMLSLVSACRSNNATQPATSTSGTGAESPSATPTEAALTATPTPTKQAQAPAPDVTASASDGTIPCNLAKFVEDVTIPDGTELFPDVEFEKTWRLMNVGACTWTLDYVVGIVGENPFNTPSDTIAGIRSVVPPGEMVDLSVTLTAPPTPGTYRVYFMIKAPDGELFGIDDGGEPFWLEIEVVL